MSVRLEWTVAEYAGVSFHRKGERLEDGQRVTKPLALVIGSLVIEADGYPEFVKLVERIEDALGMREQEVAPESRRID